MEKRRRLGRGLEDISHYFISPHQKEDAYASAATDVETKSHVVSVVDLFNPYRGALFTSRIGIELSKKGIRTLVIDADTHFPGVAFMMGLSTPGYSFKHYIQEQYKPSDMIYSGPFGLKLLAPRLDINDINKLKVSDLSLMLETLISVEKDIDIIIQRQCRIKFQPFVENSIFIIPVSNTDMVRAYREVKSFIAGGGRKDVGIVITDTGNEVTALKAFEKVYSCINVYCGVKPYFAGYLSDMDSFSISGIVSHISELAVNSRDRIKWKRLFFDSLRYLTGADNITSVEMANLLG